MSISCQLAITLLSKSGKIATFDNTYCYEDKWKTVVGGVEKLR